MKGSKCKENSVEHNYSNLFILISEMKWKKIYLFFDKKVVFTPVQMLKLKHWFIHYQCEHYMFLYKSLCYLYTVEPRWYGHQWVKKKTGRING